MFHRNGMSPLIIANGTKRYSILDCNSPWIYIRLKDTYSVISVQLDWLPGNSKKWTIDLFVAFGVRLVHSWADMFFICVAWHVHIHDMTHFICMTWLLCYFIYKIFHIRDMALMLFHIWNLSHTQHDSFDLPCRLHEMHHVEQVKDFIH